MDNLHWLIGKATTPGFTEKHSVTTGPNNALCIKVQYLLFDVSPPYYSSEILLIGCCKPKPNLDTDATADSDNSYSHGGDSSEKSDEPGQYQ